ncbi:polysaccharide biosynthesis/export family protein [uncultured Tateyamaria sp.]|uniref:polysaccharide biosynthesis/export family protein n=1 Tax=uncultured Tateyamaria sp. TaxID=455651 RepID=UPI00263050E1|nr:polysaccharide biosynthesis/export family protein [uncultured Tateyamaria sp.]
MPDPTAIGVPSCGLAPPTIVNAPPGAEPPHDHKTPKTARRTLPHPACQIENICRINASDGLKSLSQTAKLTLGHRETSIILIGTQPVARLIIILSLALSVVFGTLTVAEAQSNYRVRTGDTLEIQVLEDPSLNRSVRVLPDGRFSFPFAGTLRAAGLTIPQIERNIRVGIASNFATDPNVFVFVVPEEREPLEPETINIYLLGEFNTPGLAEMPPGTTVLQALSMGGGMTRFAALKRLQLRRTNPKTGVQTVRKINFKALANGAALSNDIVLKDGDVILVPERRLFE